MTAKDSDNALKKSEFLVELLQLFAKHGLVNEIALRNSMIREEHQESKARGERLKDFIVKAADKYCLSEKSIDAIIYSTHKPKKLYRAIGTEST